MIKALSGRGGLFNILNMYGIKKAQFVYSPLLFSASFFLFART